MYNDVVRNLGDAIHKMQLQQCSTNVTHKPVLIGFANLRDIVHRDTIKPTNEPAGTGVDRTVCSLNCCYKCTHSRNQDQ